MNGNGRTGAPGPDATLQGAAQPVPVPVAVGMTALHLFQQRHRPHAGRADQQRQDVALPQPPSGSTTCRRRGRSAAFWEGSRGSPSIRRPVRYAQEMCCDPDPSYPFRQLTFL